MRLTPIYVAFLIVMFFSAPAVAQIYKYTDKDGNVRFTDDMGNVPESSRDSVKTIEEITFPSDELRESSKSIAEETPLSMPKAIAPDQETITATKPDQKTDKEPEDLAKEAQKSLELESDEIKGLYEQIEEEKKRLGDPPPESASGAVRRDYQQKAIYLNRRVEDYQGRVEGYRKRVKAFNDGELQNALR